MVETEVKADREAEQRTLAFIDHGRQRYADRVPLRGSEEFLIGYYGDAGRSGELGEFRVALHDLGDRTGMLHPELSVFDDGVAALARLIVLAGGDLRRILEPVAGREEFARWLLNLGLRDASDAPLPSAS